MVTQPLHLLPCRGLIVRGGVCQLVHCWVVCSAAFTAQAGAGGFAIAMRNAGLFVQAARGFGMLLGVEALLCVHASSGASSSCCKVADACMGCGVLCQSLSCCAADSSSHQASWWSGFEPSLLCTLLRWLAVLC